MVLEPNFKSEDDPTALISSKLFSPSWRDCLWQFMRKLVWVIAVVSDYGTDQWQLLFFADGIVYDEYHVRHFLYNV